MKLLELFVLFTGRHQIATSPRPFINAPIKTERLRLRSDNCAGVDPQTASLAIINLLIYTTMCLKHNYFYYMTKLSTICIVAPTQPEMDLTKLIYLPNLILIHMAFVVCGITSSICNCMFKIQNFNIYRFAYP